MIKTFHYFGFVGIDYDGFMAIKNDDWSERDEGIGQTLARELNKYSKRNASNYNEVDADNDAYIDNVQVRIYWGKSAFTLDEAIEGQIQEMAGALDVYTEWEGYSEYTVTGYSLDHFKVGNHNLEKILCGLKTKYVHFILTADLED